MTFTKFNFYGTPKIMAVSNETKNRVSKLRCPCDLENKKRFIPVAKRERMTLREKLDWTISIIPRLSNGKPDFKLIKQIRNSSADKIAENFDILTQIYTR